MMEALRGAGDLAEILTERGASASFQNLKWKEYRIPVYAKYFHPLGAVYWPVKGPE